MNHHHQLEETDADINASIQEDPRFQSGDWMAQRIAWAVGGLLLAAALLGVFGNGPLSKATLHDPEGQLTLESQRFARWESPLVLKISVTSALPEQAVRLWVSQAYLKSLRIERIMPQPKSEIASDDVVYYEFDATQAPLEVQFHMTATKFGRIEGEMGIEDQPGVKFSHLVYP